MSGRRMSLPAPPDPRACGSQWNGYVESGTTREERARRLTECPEHLRASVKAHVVTVFQIRARAKICVPDSSPG
jgi:hypothetical protein